MLMDDEKLRTRVKSHGPHQVEIKNRYPLLHKKKTVYEVDMFLLTPHHFGMDRERYGQGSKHTEELQNRLISFLRDMEFSFTVFLYSLLMKMRIIIRVKRRIV